jgi:hypothetical protein
MEEMIIGYDYLDIEVKEGKLVVTLNWEKLSIDPNRVKGFEFTFDKELAIQINIQLDTTTLNVPIKLTPADAKLFEEKKNKIFEEIQHKTPKQVIHKKSFPHRFIKLWKTIFKG